LTTKYSGSLLMCYGTTPYTPGKYLERAFRRIGVNVTLVEDTIDFASVDMKQYCAVLFVESPARPPVTVINRDQVNIPVMFWIHHGQNRLDFNLQLCEMYKPDLILMSHSLELAPRFPAPVHFFPFGVDTTIFYSDKPFSQRKHDVTFSGSLSSRYYQNRKESLQLIEETFKDKAALSLRKKLFLQELGQHYGNSKIVFNQTADELKTFNMRIFEGMGCGALLLTDPTPEQDRIFQDGVHYVVYQSKEDMLEKLSYYISHPDQAEKIAKTGQQYVLQFHTYEHRAKEILNLI